VASMIADELYAAGGICGLVCLGYPFHPMGKPEQLRTAHLGELATPTLVCQGERDIMGTREEVGGYALSPAIEIFWAPDGDRDHKPRKASGHSFADNLAAAADAVARWWPLWASAVEATQPAVAVGDAAVLDAGELVAQRERHAVVD